MIIDFHYFLVTKEKKAKNEMIKKNKIMKKINNTKII